MIKGKMLLEFNEEGVRIDTDLEITEGRADKCFIIDSVCDALELKGTEKGTALLSVAMCDSIRNMEDKE